MTPAISSAVSSRSARGTTRSTVPNASSSCAVIIEPMKNIGAQLVLGNEPREVGRDSERAAVDFGQPERRVVGGNHDVGVAGEPDASAEAKAVHGRDDGNRAVVHRGEGLVAPAVDGNQRLVGRVGGELLDVDAGLEALALGLQDHDTDIGVVTGVADRIRQREPTADGKCVHGRIVDRDDRDAVARFRADHAREHTAGQ